MILLPLTSIPLSYFGSNNGSIILYRYIYRLIVTSLCGVQKPDKNRRKSTSIIVLCTRVLYITGRATIETKNKTSWNIRPLFIDARDTPRCCRPKYIWPRRHRAIQTDEKITFRRVSTYHNITFINVHSVRISTLRKSSLDRFWHNIIL